MELFRIVVLCKLFIHLIIISKGNSNHVSNWACLHLRRLFLNLVVQIIYLFVLVDKLAQLSYVLLVEFHFARHVLQVRAVALKLALASVLLGLIFLVLVLLLGC